MNCFFLSFTYHDFKAHQWSLVACHLISAWLHTDSGPPHKSTLVEGWHFWKRTANKQIISELVCTQEPHSHTQQAAYFPRLSLLWFLARQRSLVVCSSQSASCTQLLHTRGMFNLKMCTVLFRFLDWTTCFFSTVCNGLSDTFSPVWWACHRCYPIRRDVYLNKAVLKMQYTQWILERCFTNAATVSCCIQHLKKLKGMFVVFL